MIKGDRVDILWHETNSKHKLRKKSDQNPPFLKKKNSWGGGTWKLPHQSEYDLPYFHLSPLGVWGILIGHRWACSTCEKLVTCIHPATFRTKISVDFYLSTGSDCSRSVSGVQPLGNSACTCLQQSALCRVSVDCWTNTNWVRPPRNSTYCDICR